jgi:thymidylate synthase (FAD)
MKAVEPEVHLVAAPWIDWAELAGYILSAGGEEWYNAATPAGNDVTGDAANLVELGGRLCYKSWAPGVNPNVTKVRKDQAAYIANLLAAEHGSVLEHANFTLILENVSRVLTHELVRHRAGVAVSQESLRFVRIDGEIPFWLPSWVLEDDQLARDIRNYLHDAERIQQVMAAKFELDVPGISFSHKKEKTSFMRRLLPEGLATQIMITANVRALRHIIVMRTASGAEEEIRLVAGKIAALMTEREPLLFGDITLQEDGAWDTPHRKV